MEGLLGLLLGLMLVGIPLLMVAVPLAVGMALAFIAGRSIYRWVVNRLGWSLPAFPGSRRVPRLVRWAVVCGVFFWALFAVLGRLWCSTQTIEVPSPGGRYVAFIENSSCGGAAGAIYTDVGIRWEWDRLQLRSERVAMSSGSWLKPPRLEWTDDHTLIVGGLPTRVQEWDGVRIEQVRD
jgi:hypothetical protein